MPDRERMFTAQWQLEEEEGGTDAAEAIAVDRGRGLHDH